jgi:hypothetical protein
MLEEYVNHIDLNNLGTSDNIYEFSILIVLDLSKNKGFFDILKKISNYSIYTDGSANEIYDKFG